MASRFLSALLLATALVATVSATAVSASAFPTCRGSAKYKVTFLNNLTPENFGSLIPFTGLVYSPLAGFSHSNRQSFFTVRGFANKRVEQVAETGINTKIIRFGRRLRNQGRGVLSVVDAGKPTMPGKATTLILRVDCQHPFVTVLGMIAPSPDWIVQINNRNLFDTARGRFVERASGDLIAYDTGVDDGREFTAPLDLSLDLPTEPRKNIAPLVEDETDRFEGRVVGRYFIQRI